MGRGSSKVSGRNVVAMTKESRFDGLDARTMKNGSIILSSVSEDGNKIAVVLDRNSIITKYDNDGRKFYLVTGENEGVRLDNWQVSATGNTSDAKAAQARVVLLDKTTFDRERLPLETGYVGKSDFSVYKNTAKLQSKAKGDTYGMGFVSGFDDNDNPTRFSPKFIESEYGKSYRKKKSK